MPGSFLSSSINRDIGSANRDIRQSSFTSIVIQSAKFLHFVQDDKGKGRHLESADAEPTQHAANRGLHHRIDLACGFVHRGKNQILQHFDVARLHRLRIDTQTKELLAAIHFRRDRSATRRGFDYRLLHFLLQRVVLGFRFRHQILQIESAHGGFSASPCSQSPYESAPRIFPACAAPRDLVLPGCGLRHWRPCRTALLRLVAFLRWSRSLRQGLSSASPPARELRWPKRLPAVWPRRSATYQLPLPKPRR